LGWITGVLSPAQPTVRYPLYLNSAAQGQYSFGNAFVGATISQTNNWAIISLIDKATGQELLGSQGAGDLVFYQDDGNIYRFGNEMANCGWNVDASISITAQNIATGGFEYGPSYVSITTVLVRHISIYPLVSPYCLG